MIVYCNPWPTFKPKKVTVYRDAKKAIRHAVRPTKKGTRTITRCLYDGTEQHPNNVRFIVTHAK